MRICYLSSACIPSRTANSIHVMKMCQALARAGNDVTLFANQNVRILENVDDDPRGYYGIKERFDLEYAYLPSVPVGQVWYGWNIARRATKYRPDLVYGRNLAGCYYSAAKGVPVVFEAHIPIEKGRPMVGFMLRRLTQMPTFKYLTVITRALRRHYERKWPDLEGRIVVAPDGADIIDDDVVPKELGVEKNRLQIGYAGHLYRGKGAELVLDLARIAPEYDFHIVGGSHVDLERWRRRDDLPRNLTLHGHRPPSEIPSYLLAFDILLLPNQPKVLSHRGKADIGGWTSPLKLFEYMAAGRPIICSDVPVLQEVAKHGVNMLVCPWGHPEKWLDSIRHIEREPNLKEEMSENAQKELGEWYSWEARATRLVESLISRSCIF